MRRLLLRFVIIAIVLAAAWGGFWFVKQLPRRQQPVATARVRRGDVVIRTYSRGELRAVRSATLNAPNLFSAVQVTRLAPVGSLAQEKDLIVEFDDSDRRANLEETLLEVEQIDEQIKKALADLAIRDNQDQVDLLKTRYAVRRGELEVTRNELLSAIDAKKNLLTLEEQRRRLQQLQSDIKSRREQAQAELAVLREQRNKSMIDVAREKQRIAQAKVLSPMTGLVAIRQNRNQGFFFFGMQLPDIREGDTLQPGVAVADILDLSELEVVAKVGELDRANLHEGQEALLMLDALPDKKFHGKIKSMSGTASANVFSGDPAKKFDVVFSIDMKQLLTALGAKPEEIKKIMETARRNAKKSPPPAPAMPMMVFAGPGIPAGPGAPPGGGRTMAYGRTEGPSGMSGGPPGSTSTVMTFARGSQVSEQDRKKLQEVMQKALGGKRPEELSPEERQKIFANLRGSMGRANPQPAGGPGVRAGGPDQLMGAMVPGQSSEANLAKAKLPPAPEEDSQLDVLLRPGLLADVEIIVEKIPNAINIPAQAVFEKEGKPIVYAQSGKRFEERPIKIAKRSESVMVIAGGLQVGETVALADPYARKSDKKGEKKNSAGPMMPTGGK